MRILLLGAGGRECALAFKISQSPLCSALYIAPGNAGTEEYGKNIFISTTDFPALAEFCSDTQIDMIVVGPEDPLVQGISEYFSQKIELRHIAIIGPNKQAAMLEGSKSFAKDFMKRYNIPTAKYESFSAEMTSDAKQFLSSLKAPYVIKADGLAAGKGVVICNSTDEAEKVIDNMLSGNAFGKAGETIIIEEYLRGIEMSVFVLTDGENFVLLPEAKDYKRIGEYDTGLNTGGMGAVSPVPFFNDVLKEKIISKIILPTLNGLKKEHIQYTGFIFLGLMISGNEPFVIEYNVRLGDPETQAVMSRIDSDIVDLFKALSEKKLNNCQIQINPDYAVNVVLSSGGYPEQFEKNKTVCFGKIPSGTHLFHAGTGKNEKQNIITLGGRVFSCCGKGKTIQEARENAYRLIDEVYFENMYFRKDIGLDLL